MPLPTWPVGVPDVPLVESWDKPEPYQEPLQTEMEGGNKRLRTKAGMNVARVTYELKPMTPAQFDSFETFVKTGLSFGTSRFVTRVLLGSSMQTKTVQFASRYKTRRDPPLYVIGVDYWVYGI